MNSLFTLKPTKKNNANKKNNNLKKNTNSKLFPLGISVKTQHVHPPIPTREVMYDIVFPKFQKKIDVKHLKSGKIKITWTLNPPKTIKPTVKNRKNHENHSECTKRMISNLNSKNISNTNKIKEIKEKCKLY